MVLILTAPVDILYQHRQDKAYYVCS